MRLKHLNFLGQQWITTQCKHAECWNIYTASILVPYQLAFLLAVKYKFQFLKPFSLEYIYTHMYIYMYISFILIKLI